MADLETAIKEAEQLHIEIDKALDPLSARELLKIFQYITENFWTATEEQRQALEKEEE